MKLYSNSKSRLFDNNNSYYSFDSFEYNIEKEFLKAKNINLIENFNSNIDEKTKYNFSSGFFDLKKKEFYTGDAKIYLKNIFDRKENDPRIFGVSSSHKNNITKIKKAVFTSCKINEKCPPWRLESSEISHDKNKKQILYENTVLKLYDYPVFYFPKFFHPDPTVKRQSGLLTPKINNSNILGSSIGVPYYYVISDNKDLTFNTSLFSKNIIMFQNEFRQKNKNSDLIADVGLVNGYKPSTTKKKKYKSYIC